MSLVGRNYFGNPSQGNKTFSHVVSLHTEKAGQNVYVKSEKRLDDCTEVLVAP